MTARDVDDRQAAYRQSDARTDVRACVIGTPVRQDLPHPRQGRGVDVSRRGGSRDSADATHESDPSEWFPTVSRHESTPAVRPDMAQLSCECTHVWSQPLRGDTPRSTASDRSCGYARAIPLSTQIAGRARTPSQLSAIQASACGMRCAEATSDTSATKSRPNGRLLSAFSRAFRACRAPLLAVVCLDRRRARWRLSSRSRRLQRREDRAAMRAAAVVGTALRPERFGVATRAPHPRRCSEPLRPRGYSRFAL